jgi:monofunctional biosynthetic peptidoglycan transglycosylase
MKKFLKILKYIVFAIIGYILFAPIWVLLYKFVPVPITFHMVQRVFEGYGLDKDWVSYEEVSPNFFRAVIGGEDGRFMSHEGIDWKAVEDAKRYNERNEGKKKRGASTITMQTAKNTFLWHGRNYVRKGLEVYYTYLIEYIWGKKRILEVYVNVVELGEGVYGVEAASRKYFGKSASSLSQREAALLASVLPNPIRWSPAKPTPYIEKRVSFIMGRMGVAIPKADKKGK